MASLVRYRPPETGESSDEACQLSLSVFDPREGRHSSATWISSGMLAQALVKLRSSENGIDADVRRALIRELEDGGPPEPILLEPEPVEYIGSPVRVAWNGFSLEQGDDGFTLGFSEPASDRRVSLHLATGGARPGRPWGNDYEELEDHFAWRGYPRLRLEGSIGPGEGATGEASLEYQYGDPEWLGDVNEVLGWDWFGMNLEDGSEWVVLVHRDPKTGEPLAGCVSVHDRDGNGRTSHDLTLEKVREWESPSTRIRYPIAWKIEVPEFEAELHFEPLADDQEIASFGAVRAVWSGVGTVEGSVAGSPARGTARGEFYGYGCIFDFQDYLAQMGERVDRRLEEFFPKKFTDEDVEKYVGPPVWKHEPEAYTQTLAVPVWDLIERSGKRWRPIFGILMLEALGVRSEPYEGLICNMTELIHTGALIVDDIEDESKLRRGAECLHLRYGMDVALNAANALYFLPGLALMNHPSLSPEKRRRLHEIKEHVCIDAHCGQTTDIFWSRTMTAERLNEWLQEDLEGKILQMYAFKTAAGAKGLAEFAAVMADADPELTLACSDFARAFAVSFQVIDDIHNFSDSPRWTKVMGEDIANGKLTFVIARALHMLEPEKSNRLREILCSPELRAAGAAMDEGVALVRESGSLEVCRDRAKTMMEEAWDRFTHHVRPSQPKMMLHAMCLKMLELAYDA